MIATIILVSFGLIVLAAAIDPTNRKGYDDGLDDADVWSL
jgi:hypothetical protein